MPLGIGMGLSVGAGNGLPLSSSWSSVADIPPGMLVLDNDGDVWQADGTTLVSVTAYIRNEFGEIIENEFNEHITAFYE